MKSRSFKIARVLTALIAPLTALFLYQGCIRQDHRLLSLRDWVSTKSSGSVFQSSLMGSKAFLHGRTALAGDRLLLSAWHGHQEMSVNRAGHLRELEFRMRLEPEAYLILVFDQKSGHRRAFRFSRNSSHPSSRMDVLEEGEIRHLNALALEIGDGWRNLLLRREEERLFVYLNGEVIHEEILGEPKRSFISFRAGRKGVELDDIRLVTDEFKFQENFAPRFDGKVLLWAFLVSAVISILGWRRPFAGLTTQMALLLFLGAWVTFDRFIWSERYFHDSLFERGRSEISDAFFRMLGRPLYPVVMHPRVHETLVGVAREPEGRLWEDHGALISPEGQVHLRSPAIPDSGRRILFFLGGSQTWGSGAIHATRTLAALTIREINALYPGCELWGLNLARNAARLHERLGDYQAEAELWKPSAVILNAGFNDGSVLPEFKVALEELVDFNERVGVRTFFSLEPQSAEVESTDGKAHALMSEIAARRSIPVFDAHAWMRALELEDRHWLWWDEIHFTPVGHGEMARRWADEFGASICGQNLKR